MNVAVGLPSSVMVAMAVEPYRGLVTCHDYTSLVDVKCSISIWGNSVAQPCFLTMPVVMVVSQSFIVFVPPLTLLLQSVPGLARSINIPLPTF